MDMTYPLERDMVDLCKVAEPLSHELRQYLIKQGADLAQLTKKKVVNGAD